MQKEPSVKIFPFSVEFRRHCVLSGGTECRTLPQHQSEDFFSSKSPFLLEGKSNPQPVSLTVLRLCPCVTTELNTIYLYSYKLPNHLYYLKLTHKQHR